MPGAARLSALTVNRLRASRLSSARGRWWRRKRRCCDRGRAGSPDPRRAPEKVRGERSQCVQEDIGEYLPKIEDETGRERPVATRAIDVRNGARRRPRAPPTD